jgi:hypothetical protein
MSRRSSAESARPRGASALAALLGAVLAIATGAAPLRAQADDRSAALPLPEDVLGFRPGEARRLADWASIASYLDTLAKASDRVRVDTIGRSTLDRPITLVTISSPGNLARLEELQAIQARLADPRRIADAEERADLVRRGRLFVVVKAGLHSTEVAGSLLPVRLAYRLAASAGADVRRILDETVVLVVPSQNPDGTDVVADWYRSTVDMPWEGSEPPFLYHHYAGHDNNRDWYAFALAETRTVVEEVYNAWHPQIVLDVHQQDSEGSRLFVPPWIDPVEPNVDPILIAGATKLGSAIAWSLLREGKSGVLVAGDFDAWSPSRAYAHYHGAVRVLTETASARLASPVTVPFERLRAGRGYDAKRASWNFPRPWPGGRWSLADALDYMESSSLALLREASEERTAWLRSFVAVGERALEGRPGWPRAWAIVPSQRDSGAPEALVDALVTGAVEVRRATGPFTQAGRTYPAGTYVVDMRQPYAAFAQILMAPEPYPPSFGPDGRPLAPYDGTAHTLALLLGAEAVPLGATPGVATERVTESERPRLLAPGVSDDPGVLVGLYRSWVPDPDEGWVRWWFDRASVPYAVLDDAELAAGDLARRFTSIVIPSAEAVVLRDGWRVDQQPPLYTGGLGGAGVEALRAYVEEGGTLVTLGRASGFAIPALDLPVDDPLAGTEENDFLAPGAIVSVAVDTSAALGRGLPRRIAAWIDHPVGLRPRPGSGGRVVARYGAGPTVFAGWVHGESLLAGVGAVAEVPLGRGRVVLFGFEPTYRGQARATMPLLFRALRRAGTPGAIPGAGIGEAGGGRS